MTPGADRRRRFRAPAVLLAAGFALGVAADEASPLATEQLQRMATAVNTLGFEGTLVYLHQNRLETIYIRHTIEDGQVREHLVSMTGPVRAVTREDDGVTCILPNSHPISVKRHGVAHDLLRSRALDPELLGTHYRLQPLGVARVAGRVTDVIGIIPRDDLRYGYRFYLDRETGLPLKTDLMGSDAEPIEQVMFTSVDVTRADQSPVVVPGAVVRQQPPSQAGAGWFFTQLPTGFDLLLHQAGDEGERAKVEHFLLSDGLAAISVYVELDEGQGLDGETHIGATHAAGGRVAGHRVTVVGEVPAATVAAVLAGIRYNGEAAP